VAHTDSIRFTFWPCPYIRIVSYRIRVEDVGFRLYVFFLVITESLYCIDHFYMYFEFRQYHIYSHNKHLDYANNYLSCSLKTINWTWVNNKWWQTVPQVNNSLSKRVFSHVIFTVLLNYFKIVSSCGRECLFISPRSGSTLEQGGALAPRFTTAPRLKS